jgi:hypothetical protein
MPTVFGCIADKVQDRATTFGCIDKKVQQQQTTFASLLIRTHFN